MDTTVTWADLDAANVADGTYQRKHNWKSPALLNAERAYDKAVELYCENSDSEILKAFAIIEHLRYLLVDLCWIDEYWRHATCTCTPELPDGRGGGLCQACSREKAAREWAEKNKDGDWWKRSLRHQLYCDCVYSAHCV